MSTKTRVYCVTAYNKDDIKSAQERGRINKMHRPRKRPLHILPDGKAAKYKTPSPGFKGQAGFYFLYKKDAITKKEELEKEYDVVKMRKCKLKK